MQRLGTPDRNLSYARSGLALCVLLEIKLIPLLLRISGILIYLGTTPPGLSTCTETSSVRHREFWRDLTTSSAVNLPISRASLRLGVIWTGVRSTRCTYCVMPLARFTFTTNFVFMVFHTCPRCRQELKEVLPTHGHRSLPLIDPVFPNSDEAGSQSSFSCCRPCLFSVCRDERKATWRSSGYFQVRVNTEASGTTTSAAMPASCR